MYTIISLENTVIKKENQNSNLLSSDQLIEIPKNTKLEIKNIVEDKKKHYKISLVADNKFQDGYIYQNHWDLSTTRNNQIIQLDVPYYVRLEVPYYTQIDNSTNLFGTGYRQCNLTVHAMYLEYLLSKYELETLQTKQEKGNFKEPESVYGKTLRRYGDTIYHDAHTRALKEYNVESYFSYTLNIDNLLNILKLGFPIPISVAYKQSGHVILVVGFNPEKNFFYVHDPYGSRDGNRNTYARLGQKFGKYDTYNMNTLISIFNKSKNNKSGWGRIVTSVNGINTGCPEGL